MADRKLNLTHRQDEVRHVFFIKSSPLRNIFSFATWYISTYIYISIYVVKSKKQRRGMARKKKRRRRDKANGWKYDERGGTRGKRYEVLWTFNKAHAKLLARCLRFHCAVFACVETTDAANVLRCGVEGGHRGRFVEFLHETQEWIMARCKQSSTRPPNCNFLCLILVTRMKEIQQIYMYTRTWTVRFFCIPRHFIFSKKYFWPFLSSPLIFFFFFLISLFSIFSKGLLLFRIGGLARSNYLCSKKKNVGFSSRSSNCFLPITILQVI